MRLQLWHERPRMTIVQHSPIEILDLQSAISNQVHQIGDAVSARIHISGLDPLTEWSVLEKIADAVLISAFGNQTFEWRSRTGGSGRLSNRLGENAMGKTALVTLARGYEESISVTLFGNYGTLRFEESAFVIEVG